MIINGGSATWLISGNSVRGGEAGGPSPGMGFVNLPSDASFNVTGNTIENALGVALGILRSAADFAAPSSCLLRASCKFALTWRF